MPPGSTEAPEEGGDVVTDRAPAARDGRADGEAPPDVHKVLEALRRDVERAFAGELDRIEKSFGTYVADLQHKLADTEERLAKLAAERGQLATENAALERKWKAVRDLAGNAGR